ncbi:MAG: hypothetical protein ABI411_05200 [Tahibacter sp.]
MTTYHPEPGSQRGEALANIRAVQIAAIVWPSFFAACVASMVFFAVVDPAELAQLTWPHLLVTRELGYSIGFFMFWSCTASACSFTALLLSPPPSRSTPQRP